MTDNAELIPEVWTYAGIRNDGGKRAHAWIDPGGHEYWYGGKGSFGIGYSYDVKVSRTADSVRRTTPVYKGTSDVSPEKRREWAALDRAAQTAIASHRLAANAARSDALAELVDPLAELARNLSMAADRDALAAYVLRRISSAWR